MTVTVDIIPLNVVVEGESFNGSDVVDATLASPVFALNDYGFTPFATAPGGIQGPGGVLSQNDAGNQLQVLDATMRAQFNKTGASTYHLILHPHVLSAVTINVPNEQGVLLQSGRGVVFADINIKWWSEQMKNLNSTRGDPIHLPNYLTDDVLL